MNEPSVPPRARVVELVLGVVALLCALPAIGAVSGAIAARLDFPGDLEWMEGATLVSAQRAHDGLSLYGAPAADYIPFIYPPLYAWTVGLLGHVWTVGYPLGRAVSVVGSVAGALAGVFAARREGASWPLALASLGLFAACWDDSGTFYDLVRTDGLALGLMGWSLVLLPVATRPAVIASGLLLAVAFMAKQHVALLGVPMLGWLWWAHGRARALEFVRASVVPAVVFVIGMAAATGGRFVVWLVGVPAVHGQSAERLFPGAQVEVWEALPITTTAILLTSPWWARRRPYWAAMSLAILVVVSLMRGHTGGYLNVLIPAFWALSFLPAALAGAWGGRAPWVASVLVALQALTWNLDWSVFTRRLGGGQSPVSAFADAQRSLAKFVPTTADREAAAAFVEELRALPDPILIPHGPWYAVMAGKRASFSLITLWDIDHTYGAYQPDVARIDDAIAHDFASAVLPGDKLGHHLKEHWTPGPRLKVPGPSTRTGWPVKLNAVWYPTPEGTGDAGAGSAAPADPADPTEPAAP